MSWHLAITLSPPHLYLHLLVEERVWRSCMSDALVAKSDKYLGVISFIISYILVTCVQFNSLVATLVLFSCGGGGVQVSFVNKANERSFIC